MSIINFNDPFNAYYDQFSIHEADFTLPAYFDSYVPDNQTDYQCVSVIGPSVSRGATSWTLNNQWILIGIYRDEGRPSVQRPVITSLSWTRTGRIVTINDPNGHKLHDGDAVNVWNVNVSIVTNVTITVIDAYNFTFSGSIVGASSGANASYQDNFVTDFYENYRVFRLLPSFKLVPYESIQTIFAMTAPVPSAPLKTLYNITTAQNASVPSGTSDSINYQMPTMNLPPSENLALARRFGQVYDATGQPLPLTYLPNGYPEYVLNVDSPTKNEQIFYNSPVNPPADSRIYVYDYYGLDMNDASRSPTYSSSNVTRNPSVSGELNNLVINPATNYVSTLYDLFGNLAIGVQDDNALVVRKQVLPLEVNSFNQPTKSPS